MTGFRFSGVSRRSVLRGLGAAAVTLPAGLSAPGAAQEESPYRVVIAFPPGGDGSAVMTPLINPLSRRLGAPVELDYRPGAGGNVASLHVVRSPPDGRTLLFGHAGPLAINHHINPRSFFDPVKDLAPLALMTRFPLVICVAPRLGVNTLAEFIALAKKRDVVVGTSGNGSIQHLACEVFRRNTMINVLHVPFAGGGLLQDAVVRGDIEAVFETGANVIKFIIEGRMTPLAVMAHERLAILPDTPPLWEIGYAGLDVSAWFGLLAPAGTPAPACDTVTNAVFDAFREPALQIQFAAMGAIAVPLGPAAFAGLIQSESDRWRVVVRDAKIKPD